MDVIVNTAKKIKRKRPKEGEDEGTLSKASTPKCATDIIKLQIDKLMKDPDKLVNIPEPRKEWKPRDAPEFVRHVMGSSAGAGSGEFHVYRGIRARETKRNEFLESQAAKEKVNNEYHQQQEQNRTNAEKRTEKLRQKRLKKKKSKAVKNKIDNKINDQLMLKEAEDEDIESSEDEEKHFIIGGK